MQRLRTRPQFQAVLAGDVIARTEHFALHRNELGASAAPSDSEKTTVENAQSPSLFSAQCVWVGAMVAKRWAKRAVTRNTIKRQIYTVSAVLMHDYPKAAFVVRLRKEFSRKEFSSATSSPLKEAVRVELVALMHAGSASRRAQP